MKISMSTSIAGATIFYTTNGTAPTHSGGTATGNSTFVYSSPVTVGKGQDEFFEAIAYKSGMSDSNITEFEADNTNPN
jgi:hypothetical protein